MSIQAMAYVLEHSEAQLGDRLVLLAIANHADANGCNAYPPIDMIASEARMSERQVYRAIRSLADAGEITITSGGGRGKANGYEIVALKADRMSGLKNETLTNRARNPDKSGKKPCQDVRPTLREPKDNQETDANASVTALPARRQKPRRGFPADWMPDEQDIDYGLGKGRNHAWIAREGPACRDFHIGKGNVFADLHAAWRTWVNNAERFEAKGRRQTQGEARDATTRAFEFVTRPGYCSDDSAALAALLEPDGVARREPALDGRGLGARPRRLLA